MNLFKDAPNADVNGTLEQLTFDLELDPENTLLLSAKNGIGLQDLLVSIIERVPPPNLSPNASLLARRETDTSNNDKYLQGLLVDSYYDQFDGVVCLIRVFDGTVKTGDTIKFASHGKTYQVAKCGIMNPNRTETDVLSSGMVGWVVCGIRDPKEARVGDTLLMAEDPYGLFYSSFCNKYYFFKKNKKKTNV